MDVFNFTMFGRPAKPLGNLFCLYAINLHDQPLEQRVRIEPRALAFENYFLFIIDPHEFLNRAKKALLSLKKTFSHQMVEYIDLSKHKGKKAVFQKNLKYNYQQEFRIFIEKEDDKPVILDIGNIADISSICKVKAGEEFKIWVTEKKGDTIHLACNLDLNSRSIFRPSIQPKDFSKSIDGRLFKFMFQADEIETIYLVNTDDSSFRRIDEKTEWVIKDSVPSWIKDLEDELGNAINQANL